MNGLNRIKFILEKQVTFVFYKFKLYIKFILYIIIKYILLGGIYDFNVNKPKEMEQKVQQLQSMREKLSRSINTRAISLLDKEEEQFNEMMKKKKIVENDKTKILETIKHLDEKKRETLLKAWEQVLLFNI